MSVVGSEFVVERSFLLKYSNELIARIIRVVLLYFALQSKVNFETLGRNFFVSNIGSKTFATSVDTSTPAAPLPLGTTDTIDTHGGRRKEGIRGPLHEVCATLGRRKRKSFRYVCIAVESLQDLFEYTNNTKTQVVVSGGFPSGGVVAWYSSL